MIQTYQESKDEITEFIGQYKKLKYRVPLIISVSHYEKEMEEICQNENDIRVIIYANYLLRASCSAMEETVKNLLSD